MEREGGKEGQGGKQGQFGACSSGIDSSSLPFSHYNCKCSLPNAQLGELSRDEGGIGAGEGGEKAGAEAGEGTGEGAEERTGKGADA